MTKPQVRLVSLPERVLYGLWAETSDTTLSRDIPALSARYRAAANLGKEPALPFFVLSKDYRPATGSARLFIGSVTPGSGLTTLVLPAGTCGVITVAPKLGFLFGPAVGAAKRYFYTRWLPGSGYEAENQEYEYHTEASTGRRPRVDLVFCIRAKEEPSK